MAPPANSTSAAAHPLISNSQLFYPSPSALLSLVPPCQWKPISGPAASPTFSPPPRISRPARGGRKGSESTAGQQGGAAREISLLLSPSALTRSAPGDAEDQDPAVARRQGATRTRGRLGGQARQGRREVAVRGALAAAGARLPHLLPLRPPPRRLRRWPHALRGAPRGGGWGWRGAGLLPRRSNPGAAASPAAVYAPAATADGGTGPAGIADGRGRDHGGEGLLHPQSGFFLVRSGLRLCVGLPSDTVCVVSD